MRPKIKADGDFSRHSNDHLPYQFRAGFILERPLWYVLLQPWAATWRISVQMHYRHPTSQLKQKLYFLMTLAAINLSMGAIMSGLKMPIYLDSLGLVIATLTIGLWGGLVCALITVLVGFFLVNPYLPAYLGTAITIVLLVLILRRLGFFKNWWKGVMAGVVIAVFAAAASAPVTALVFGGVTLSGNDAITALFLSQGIEILQAAFLSGLTSELIDKTIICVCAIAILNSLPSRFYLRFGLKSLAR